MSAPELPTIDLSLFDIGDPWRDHVAAQVDWAASTFGAFQLVGHGVEGGLIDTLLELGGKYVKRGMAGPALPGFHDTVRDYATSVTGLGHKLLAAMARGLRLDDGYFADHYTGNATTSLRIADYPVALSADGQPDTDDGGKRRLLTIVKLGHPQVLRIRLKDELVAVPNVAGALYCAVGPVLQRLTQGHYVCPQQELRPGIECDRPPLCFVFEPGMGAVLTPLAVMRSRPAADLAEDYALAARC
ncbi:MAG TPA: 2-oxoglutarate and iron-dependent oxygenase domain-containing protein [Steroidobacteraceae bacterium]